MPATEYPKRPNVGDRIHTGRYGLVEVLARDGRGLQLQVRDRLGRVHLVIRAEHGVWSRPRQYQLPEEKP